jgi:hypothetical protein
MDEMARANPTSQTYLLAASTYESLGEKAQADVWRRRGEAAEKRVTQP